MPKLHFGSRGGVFYKKGGRKVYVSKFGDKLDDELLANRKKNEMVEDVCYACTNLITAMDSCLSPPRKTMYIDGQLSSGNSVEILIKYFNDNYNVKPTYKTININKIVFSPKELTNNKNPVEASKFCSRINNLYGAIDDDLVKLLLEKGHTKNIKKIIEGMVMIGKELLKKAKELNIEEDGTCYEQIMRRIDDGNRKGKKGSSVYSGHTGGYDSEGY
jgi:hypothetical protein